MYWVQIKVQVTHAGRKVRRTRKGFAPRTPGACKATQLRELAAAVEVRDGLDEEARLACLEALGVATTPTHQIETLRIYSRRWSEAKAAGWRTARRNKEVGRMLAYWVLPTLGELTAEEITHRHGVAWWTMATQRPKVRTTGWPGPYARKTLLGIWAVAKAVVEDFRAEYDLPPAWSRVRVPDLKARPQLNRQRLTLEAALEVTSQITTEAVRDLCEVVLDTGSRTREIRTLKWSQVDLERGSLKLEADDTKTGVGREVVLFERSQAILQRRWEGRGQGGEISPWVFPSGRSKAGHYTHTAVAYHLQNASERAKLGERLRPHTLRGVRATDLLSRGYAQEMVMAITGHLSAGSLAMYVRPTPEQVRQVVEGS
ncbi:MAG: hypothetical protein CMH57_02460 [Myxococcales bacterium]|nr:hypothetical protein [Myxococcales bacterium]